MGILFLMLLKIALSDNIILALLLFTHHSWYIVEASELHAHNLYIHVHLYM